MGLMQKAKKTVRAIISRRNADAGVDRKEKEFKRRFRQYAFSGEKCVDACQYEAVVTRLYHTVEKGLSYVDYRAGFGRDNIERLMAALRNYAEDGYDTERFFYKTALSVLHQYLRKNREHGCVDPELEQRVRRLKGTPNEAGGACSVTPLPEEKVRALGYGEFAVDRHSFRHFSKEPVDIGKVEAALDLAQHTPSACNRQGWKARVIVNRDKIRAICDNQNGNRGFGHEFDKMIFVTGDIRCFNRDRELFQVFIDGGMYAENILNALHYCHIASVPLSASLTPNQEEQIRRLLNMDDAEVPVMLIGIGNYPASDECLVARSERKPAEYIIVD